MDQCDLIYFGVFLMLNRGDHGLRGLRLTNSGGTV